MSKEAIEGRRQRAREAYWYACGAPGSALGAAIETATRVKITEEAIDSFTAAYFARDHAGDVRAGLTAALAELGFEVED